MAALFVLVFAASATAQTTVTASWDRNTDAYTAGYRVYYGTAPGSYQWSFDAGNQISAPINLSPGSRYYFVVRAYNAQYVYGPSSAEATIDLSTPAPTAQITATMQSSNTALVTWQTANAVSANINGTSVPLSGSTTMTVTAETTYRITATASDGRTATASATVTPVSPAPTAQITATMQSSTTALITWQTSNAASATINGSSVALSGSHTLTVTSQTTFQLVARAADGRTASASATVTPQVLAPTAQITASLQSGNTAVLNWQTGNAVSASVNGQSVALSGTASVPVSATTTFTLRAVNSSGVATTASATVTLATVSAPSAPRSLAASVSASTVTFSWQVPSSGSAPTHYLVYIGTSAGSSNVVNGYNVGNVLRVSGELGRGTYYVRVRAANTAGISANSSEVRFTVGKKLRAPSGFTVTWQGTTALLSWTAASADTSEDVPSGYVIEAGTSPGATNVARVNVGNTTRFATTITSGNYFVRVKAHNAFGESDPSEEIEIRTPGTPQAPRDLAAYGSGATVDLRWTASMGGYAPTGYVVEAGSAPGLSDLARVQVGDVTRFTTVAPPGVYYVRVRAVNAKGTSLPSNEVVVRR